MLDRARRRGNRLPLSIIPVCDNLPGYAMLLERLPDDGGCMLASGSAERVATSVRAIVVASRLVSPETLLRADRVVAETGECFDAVLTRLGLLSENKLIMLLADETGLPVAGAARLADTPKTSLSPAFLRASRALPIDVSNGVAEIAFADPLDQFVHDALAFALSSQIRPVLARASDIETAIDRLQGSVEQAISDNGLAEEADLERVADLSSDAPAIRAVNRLIAAAVEQRASDIHIEPNDEGLVVRFRIDGVLAEQEALPSSMRGSLIARIKILAGLNIAEKRLPQDGRLRLAVRGQDIDLRVATAPSIQGESAVLRILDRANLPLDLPSLGFERDAAERFLTVVHRPHGIVLVTGPTGSGKTTTLYAALADLNTTTAKLLTVEDPIEYRLTGVVQTQVSPTIGLDFATALRSFLRQDPDVIMVGEIRDGETAQVAVQAALTGHTILSTLHTVSASAAITRLLDMGVEPFLINSTLNAVLAQRLARRLCAQCSEPYVPSPSSLAAFGPAGERHASANFHRPVGCVACKRSGYHGRIALLELLVMDETIAALVLKRAAALRIERAAVAGGMRLLMEDGLFKAAAGLTSLDEVLRVVSGDFA